MAGENRGTDESVVLADRISKLPDEIREYILGYLPITDAVRTSVLSRKWRYTWTKIVQLNLYFNDDTENEMMTEDENHRYFRRVGRILMSHVGSIHKCVLRPLWYDLEGDMNAWLRLLSRKSIKDLTFSCHGVLEEIELPPSIFDCLGLSSLTLENFNLRKSIAFKGFPNLATLKLSYVDIFGDMLEQVVSNCPLEMLSLDFCCFFSDKTNSRPFKNAISAPNLRVLSMLCYSHGLNYIYLKDTPNLRVASFWIDCDGRDFDYLRAMPKIEVLTFECLLDLYKTSASASAIIPIKLPELLGNLKTVNLHSIDALSVDQMSFVFCIIRSSPNLQHLNIHMSDMCRIQLDKDSLKTAIGYLEVEAKEEIKIQNKHNNSSCNF